jgi:hypothetical protein
MLTPAYAPLDDALEMLAPYGPDLTNGNFNHAPMAVEALCALGRPDAVFPWIEAYRARMTPRQPAGDPVDWSEWRTHLGRREDFSAWSQLFAAELGEEPWRSVLDRWALRLAPGYSGAATHGAIRVGHAVRALAESETRVRLRELADALASWAASYSKLPEAPNAAGVRLSPRAAIEALPVVPPDRRPPGNITTALNRLVDFPEFAPSIDGPISAVLSTSVSASLRNSLPGSISPTRSIPGPSSSLCTASPRCTRSATSRRRSARRRPGRWRATPGRLGAGFMRRLAAPG